MVIVVVGDVMPVEELEVDVSVVVERGIAEDGLDGGADVCSGFRIDSYAHCRVEHAVDALTESVDDREVLRESLQIDQAESFVDARHGEERALGHNIRKRRTVVDGSEISDEVGVLADELLRFAVIAFAAAYDGQSDVGKRGAEAGDCLDKPADILVGGEIADVEESIARVARMLDVREPVVVDAIRLENEAAVDLVEDGLHEIGVLELLSDAFGDEEDLLGIEEDLAAEGVGVSGETDEIV